MARRCQSSLPKDFRAAGATASESALTSPLLKAAFFIEFSQCCRTSRMSRELLSPPARNGGIKSTTMPADWRELYRVAIVETDNEKLPACLPADRKGCD